MYIYIWFPPGAKKNHRLKSAGWDQGYVIVPIRQVGFGGQNPVLKTYGKLLEICSKGTELQTGGLFSIKSSQWKVHNCLRCGSYWDHEAWLLLLCTADQTFLSTNTNLNSGRFQVLGRFNFQLSSTCRVVGSQICADGMRMKNHNSIW